LNAADEVAVKAFTEGKISFLSIYDVVEGVLSGWDTKEIETEDDIWDADQRAREAAKKEVEAIGLC
jgi:1-deoxy-D-xylulose 5-phosphate reductoisomerase